MAGFPGFSLYNGPAACGGANSGEGLTMAGKQEVEKRSYND